MNNLYRIFNTNSNSKEEGEIIMKKLSVKMLLILFVLVAVLFVATNTVKATSGAVNPLQVQSGTGTTTSGTLTTTPTPTPSTTTTPTPTTNTQTSAYQNNTNLPKTGDAEDFAIMLFIGVCAVVSVFAYRKYKNFNV